MVKRWIVVADAARARIFQAEDSHRRLRELHNLSHPESQMYAHQLRTGGKGEVVDSAGFGHHQADPQTNQSEKHADHFARELSEFLRQKRDDDAFTGLILVAEPKLLGRLRDKLDQRTAQLVVDTIDKNWAKHKTHEIEQLLKRGTDTFGTTSQ